MKSNIAQRTKKTKLYSKRRKPIIAIISAFLIITSIVLIWGYPIGGFSYIKIKNFGTNSFKQIYVKTELSYCEYDVFSFEYKNKEDYINPQKMCEENVLKMMDNNNKYSNNFEIEIVNKISHDHYLLVYTDYKYDSTNSNYFSRLTGEIMVPSVFMEIKTKNGNPQILKLWDTYTMPEFFVDYKK